MKKIILGAIALMALTGCKDEYLETVPQSSTSPATIFESTDNAKLAINGICRLMTAQYNSTQGLSGEGGVRLYNGNLPGGDFCESGRTGFKNTALMNRMEDDSNGYCQYPWEYYYKLISNANNVIVNIDGATGTQQERDFIKAQALTFRAYSYFMISQIYCKRWADSNNGASRGLVLRIEPTLDPMPASTLGETYALIYSDCEEAIRLYKASGLDRDKDDYWSPNINVAYATLAKAALTRQDWKTAADNAALARKGFNLMDADTYLSGFNSRTPETIWGIYASTEQHTYFYAWYAYMATNSTASVAKTNPPAIGRELLSTIPASDIRHQLILEMSDEEWQKCIDNKCTGANSYITTAGLANSKDKSALLSKRAKAQIGSRLNASTKIYANMYTKFQATDMPGVGIFSMIRASEMLLTEAEALLEQGGHDADVQALLVELNRTSGRDPEYSCALTGSSLRDEVRKYRKFELWGEGFSWFDYKRWNITMERKSYQKGGACHPDMAIKVEPQDKHAWTQVFPRNETLYNDQVTAAE